MATITDNTGIESLADVAGIVWVKTKYPSHTNYRSADGRFFIGETPKRYFLLSVRNAAGEFTPRVRSVTRSPPCATPRSTRLVSNDRHAGDVPRPQPRAPRRPTPGCASSP